MLYAMDTTHCFTSSEQVSDLLHSRNGKLEGAEDDRRWCSNGEENEEHYVQQGFSRYDLCSPHHEEQRQRHSRTQDQPEGGVQQQCRMRLEEQQQQQQLDWELQQQRLWELQEQNDIQEQQQQQQQQLHALPFSSALLPPSHTQYVPTTQSFARRGSTLHSPRIPTERAPSPPPSPFLIPQRCHPSQQQPQYHCQATGAPPPPLSQPPPFYPHAPYQQLTHSHSPCPPQPTPHGYHDFHPADLHQQSCDHLGYDEPFGRHHQTPSASTAGQFYGLGAQTWLVQSFKGCMGNM